MTCNVSREHVLSPVCCWCKGDTKLNIQVFPNSVPVQYAQLHKDNIAIGFYGGNFHQPETGSNCQRQILRILSNMCCQPGIQY